MTPQSRVFSQAVGYGADSPADGSVPQAKASRDRLEVSPCHPASRIDPHLADLTGSPGGLHQVLHTLPIGLGHSAQYGFELRLPRLLLDRRNFRVVRPYDGALELL